MVRKLAAAMLGVGVFIPGLANALGLGEIKLNSALSEPLDAEIELVQVRELTQAEILPGLAAQSDFEASHIERYHFLTDLKFEVTVNEQGKSVIKIRSRKPVKEPFLNFLVEVNWPAGRLLREYTLLLDPPIYSQQKVEPVKQAQASTAASQRTAPVSSYEPASSPQTTYTADTYSSDGMGSGQADQVGTHTIGSNDSLWSIASSMKPSNRVSIQQTMMAIQRINPDAFINNNINLLKKGQVLRAPTEEEAMQLTSREAIALAAEQNRQWQQRGSAQAQRSPEARQIDLSGRSVERESDPAPAASEARLKLVSGAADGSGDSGQGGAGDGGQLRDQLAMAEENVDKYTLENDELKLKVNDLEDQLDTSDKVLTLKDEQIAALQAKLRELEKQQEMAAMEAEGLESSEVAEETSAMEGAMPASEALLTDSDEAEAAGMVDEESVSEADVASEEVDFNYQEETADAVMQGDEQGEEAGETVSTETPEEAAPEVAAEIADQIDPIQDQQDLVQQILSNPMYLAAGGGAILLILVLILLAARRKPAHEAVDDDSLEEFELPEAQSSEEMPEFDSVDLEEDDAFEEAVEASAEEETVAQTSDVIAEADIYIAYGRFPQAIEMLEKAAESEPERSDIRLKLCEVSAEANEPNTFQNHYGVLQYLGDSSAIAKADQLKEKLPDMDETIIAPSDQAEEVIEDFETSESLDDLDEEPSAESAFDFDLGDDELGDTDLSSVESELDQETDTGLDFDLADLEDTGASFETTAEPEHPPTDPMTEEEQAAGDVAGLDFDLNLDLEDADEQASDSEDVSLDFDSDFSLDSVDEDEGSAELDVDFDNLETDEPSTESLDSEDASLDFDLDFDASTTDLSEDDATLLQPAEAASGASAPSEEEPMLDSQSAAQLADELDLDLDADFLTEEPSLGVADIEAAPEAPALDTDDDATIIADLDMSEPSPAANDFEESAEELDFLSDADEASTKLDLARAYIDMGDRDGAKDILDEVMLEGSDTQKQEAKDLLTRLES